MTSIYFARREHLCRPWPRHWLRFERDMKRLGLEVHECQGPNGWGGPAVSVPEEGVGRVKHGTPVRLDRHVAGESVVLYPAPIWIG